MLEQLANKITSPISGRIASAVFYKALVVYLFLKLLLTRTVVSDIAIYHSFSTPKSGFTSLLYAPVTWAADNITVFLRLSMVFLVWVVFVRLNYFMAVLVGAIAFCFYLISFPVANGSDQVLISLLIFAIPICAAPEFTTSEKLQVAQSGLYNFSRLFCMLYVCSIYLISGLDKIESESWRSGEAIGFIAKLPYMVPPGLAETFPQSGGARLFLAWLVILYELSFPILVWFRKTRSGLLVVGVLFHLAIAFFLSLPDFGLIMIISYLIFLNDEDYERIKAILKFKRSK